MKLADLEHARVAVWGFGREGRAALTVLRKRFPRKALTVFCNAQEADAARVEGVTVESVPPDAAALARFDIVIKSPGISPYKSPVPEAMAAGVKFTSGTALWFAENPNAHVIGVTGTKGKSTTSALIAYLARSLGMRTALAGNIGLPLLSLLDRQADLWVVELSSFQTGDAGPLDVGVITNLYEEHLDWHGTPERYKVDKLKLADVARTLVVNADLPELLARTASHSQRVTFGDHAGWHVRDTAIWRGDKSVLPLTEISLPGEHNAMNVCVALAAMEATGFDSAAASRHVATFMPLPHRLQTLGKRDGIEYINDSISTTPHATIEALRSLQGRAVTVLVGGFDRGVDWNPFVEYVAKHPPHSILAMGANGPRIAAALAASKSDLRQTESLEQALALAKKMTPAGGAILLSPGAPSFDQFKDYAERGREFARLAGFDPTGIAQIEGLGIA